MPKQKPLHPSQKLVTAAEVLAIFERIVPILDQRYVKRHPDAPVARATSDAD